MKPENLDKTVFRLIDNHTGDFVGAYERSYNTVFDFDSLEAARTSNCHGIFEDKKAYSVNKYRVIYQLLEEDCDET